MTASQPRAESGSIRTERGILRALLDPVVVILVLAGIFDGLAGNPIHSTLLIAVAVALAWDGLTGTLPATAAGGAPVLEREAEATTGPGRPDLRTVALGGALVIAFSILVGGFGRYSAPATVAVIAPAGLAIAIAWRRSARDVGPQPSPLAIGGKIAWASVFVAASLWELAALLLQPTLTTDSYAHPTISVLTDPILATHPGRSIALLLWLGLGWFLVGR
jgi:hypothetical protein